MRKYTNVLVVEDDNISVFLITLLLRESDLVESISVAANGEEALAYMQRLKTNGGRYPEFIFLDINMPVMDGFTFLEACRQAGCLEGNASKIIVLTSFAHQIDMHKAQEPGVSEYLLKPVSAEAILAAIHG